MSKFKLGDTRARNKDGLITVETITKAVGSRKKAGLVVANAAAIPSWLSEEHAPKEVLSRKNTLTMDTQTQMMMQHSPLQGTFTDGFAVYNTFISVKNCDHFKFSVNTDGHEFMRNLDTMFELSNDLDADVRDFFIFYSGLGKNYNGDWIGYDVAKAEVHYITLKSIVKKWIARHNRLLKSDKSKRNIDTSTRDVDDNSGGNSDDSRIELYRPSLNSGVFGCINYPPSEESPENKESEAERAEKDLRMRIRKKSMDEYLFICIDTNYAGIWVQNAIDKKLFSKYNIIVQSSVNGQEQCTEITVGEIKPDTCWISQRVCGKFTHCWLDICNTFTELDRPLSDFMVDLKGSFAVVKKQIIWDDNPQYWAEHDHPMCNVEAPDGDRTMIVFPSYGLEKFKKKHKKKKSKKKVGFDMSDFAHELDSQRSALTTITVSDDDDEDDDMREVDFAAMAADAKRKKPRRSSHLPQPSVRRLGVLAGIAAGDAILKPSAERKMKQHNYHVSTYSRGFLFTSVLKDIRQLVVGDIEEDEYYASKNEVDNYEWLDS